MRSPLAWWRQHQAMKRMRKQFQLGMTGGTRPILLPDTVTEINDFQCGVCLARRHPFDLDVYVRRFFHPTGVATTQYVNYCNDKAECIAQAPTIATHMQPDEPSSEWQKHAYGCTPVKQHVMAEVQWDCVQGCPTNGS